MSTASSKESTTEGVFSTDVLAALNSAVQAIPLAQQTAEKEGVEIRRYEVIYDLVEDIEKAIEGLLAPDTIEEVCGHAVVLEVFRSSRFGTIAGVKVETGFIKRNCKVRLIRDDVVIHEGDLSQLKRFKDDVNEVKGTECGVAFANYQDLKIGDRIECVFF